jgi:hypothetical protein
MLSSESYATTFDMIINLNMKKETTPAEDSVKEPAEERRVARGRRPIADAEAHERNSSKSNEDGS